MESWRPSKLIRAGNLGGETDISGLTSHTTAQMQRNADDGLSRTPLSEGGTGGQLVLVNSAKRTELTTESARRTEKAE